MFGKKTPTQITVISEKEYDHCNPNKDLERTVIETIRRNITPYKGGRDRDLSKTHGYVSYKGVRCFVSRGTYETDWTLNILSPHNWKLIHKLNG
jgi:hypothetical protein